MRARLSTRSVANALRRAQFRWRCIESRTRLVIIVFVVTLAGLLWNYGLHHSDQTSTSSSTTSTSAAPDSTDSPQNEPLSPSELPPTPDASPEGARAVVERFSTNFANPNGNFDDWFARISPDISPQLAEQYRMTDIRNVTQTSVTSVTGPVNRMPGTMAFDVTYADSDRVTIRVEMGVEGWKIINVLPLKAPANADPAPPVEAGNG